MNNETIPAQNARHMMSITDHEPKMNQLIRGLLWLVVLVRYAAFLPVLVRAAMVIPPTQSA